MTRHGSAKRRRGSSASAGPARSTMPWCEPGRRTTVASLMPRRDAPSESASIRDQAQKMVARHETEWDRVDYDAVRKACNEAHEPAAVGRARQKALDYVRTEYPPRQRKARVQKWLDWFEGLQKPRDYYITV